MSLAVFNGSPRGKSSNSSIITEWFLAGYNKEHTIDYLSKYKQRDHQIQTFVHSTHILMVFPLYVDGMPGQVKAFFEGFLPFKNEVKGKKITFIIHSGFQEGVQNRALESYLNRFAEILNLNNQGVVVIPGSEGFRLMPAAMTKKKSAAVGRIAKCFVSSQPYSDSDLNILAPTETMSSWSRLVFKMMKKLGLTNMYWNSNLKKNNAYDKRFDAPYQNNPVKITTDAYLKNF